MTDHMITGRDASWVMTSAVIVFTMQTGKCNHVMLYFCSLGGGAGGGGYKPKMEVLGGGGRSGPYKHEIELSTVCSELC